MTRFMPLRAAIVALACLILVSGRAVADTPKAVDVPAGELVDALEALAKQCGIDVVYPSAELKGLKTQGVHGSFEAREAFRKLVEGTGLTIKEEGSSILVVPAGSKSHSAVPGETKGESGPEPAGNARLTQADQAGAGQGLEEVIVTGSHISSPGFQSPTPLTVVSEAELHQAGRTDIGATLADLPQFRATQAAQSTNTVTNSGQTPADLRGLGAVRTLVLVNNRRFISSDDLQTIPYSLVKRVDVVTGGASAAYGSDAVAGVVNIILDEDKEGIEVGAQGGRSTHGDADKKLFEASFGKKFFDDRAHFMIGADYMKDDGIIPATRRPLVGATGFLPGGDGYLYPTADLHEWRRSTGGLINTGVLQGMTFNPDGSLRPFQYGYIPPGSRTYMVGGEGYDIDQYRSISAPIERGNALAHFSFQLNDSMKVWAEGIYNKVADNRPYFPDLAVTQLTFNWDNPFLNLTPAERAAVTNAGETQFTMGRALTDMAMARYQYDRTATQFTVGLDGTFGSQWRYNLYYGHGKQEQDMRLHNIVLGQQFANAIDAVMGPGGTPVCRVALTDPTTACRPLNLFGSGRADPAAVAYSTGTWRDLQQTWLDTAGAIVSGEPFQLRDQPISVATGFEYRKQQMQVDMDPNSQAGNFLLIDGANIPKVGNNVKEGFVEVGVPVVLNQPFAKKLDFNGAARISDYSTSGSIWSWKLGAIWQVVDDLKFRVTRSRDIRAPNLVELYTTPDTYYTSVVDVSRNPPPTSAVILYTGGNTKLAPEIADTLTLGAVITPSFLPDFQFSLDYYHIKIKDVIISLEAQQIVNSCYQQNDQSACSQIVRGADGSISSINATYINLAQFESKGVDLEASYRTRLDRIGLPGQLTLRALANYVKTNSQYDGLETIEGAGYVSAYTDFLVPKWRSTMSATYESNRIGGDLRLRYVGSAGYAPPEVVKIGNNDVAARTYVDLGVRTYIPLPGDGRLTVFGSIQNVFDRQPPLAAVNSAYYDIIGRYFTLGVRANF